MKKVCLLVPDKMLHSFGGSRSNKSEEMEVTAETLIYALCLDDYHETFHFRMNEVKVLSLETIEK